MLWLLTFSLKMPYSFWPFPYSKPALPNTQRDINAASSSIHLMPIPPHAVPSHKHRPPTDPVLRVTTVTRGSPCSNLATLSVVRGAAPGAGWKQRIHVTPRPTESELQFHKVPKWFKDTLTFQKHCSVPCDPISPDTMDLQKECDPKPKTCIQGLESSLRGGWYALCAAGSLLMNRE